MNKAFVLPEIGINAGLFDGCTAFIGNKTLGTFKYVTDADFYAFRYHLHAVWNRITIYRNAIEYRAKNGKIMTLDAMNNAKDFIQVCDTEALAIEVPANDASVMLSLSRILQSMNRNIPHTKSKAFPIWEKANSAINQFTIKYQKQ